MNYEVKHVSYQIVTNDFVCFEKMMSLKNSDNISCNLPALQALIS